MGLLLTTDLNSIDFESSIRTISSGMSILQVIYDPAFWEREPADLGRSPHGYVIIDPAGGNNYIEVRFESEAGGELSVVPGSTFRVGSKRAPAEGATVKIVEL